MWIPRFHPASHPVELRHFVNSAYWTFTALDVARLEVRFCSVSARVDKAPEHNLGNLDAFNTDGLLDGARCPNMMMWWKLLMLAVYLVWLTLPLTRNGTLPSISQSCFRIWGGQRVTSLTSSWSPNEFCQTWIKNLRFWCLGERHLHPP